MMKKSLISVGSAIAIVLLSVGMSNTNQASEGFRRQLAARAQPGGRAAAHRARACAENTRRTRGSRPASR